MNLKILLPFGVFADQSGVTRIVAQTVSGSFGFLPRRQDCVTALVPGILTYQCESQAEVAVAVDAGVLIKTGPDVLISVRNAIGGTDLAHLRATVTREFEQVDAQELRVRTTLAKIETGFIRRLATLQHG